MKMSIIPDDKEGYIEIMKEKEEEAKRYIEYFRSVIERVDEENIIEQVDIYEILEFFNENDLWKPLEWENLHPRWRWNLEQKIWEWYFGLYIEKIPIEERVPYQQKRIIISK